MVEVQPRRQWLGRALYLVLGIFVILLALIPLETVPPSFGAPKLLPIDDSAAFPEALRTESQTTTTDDPQTPIRWIAPDLLLLITIAWVIRRPSFVPALSIFGLYLLADLMLQRPPGLWAALALVLSEILRRRARSMRALSFGLEWASIGLGLIFISAIYRFILSLSLVPQAPLGLTLLHLGLTILAYPLVVFLSFLIFQVKRPAPGEVDALGHKL